MNHKKTILNLFIFLFVLSAIFAFAGDVQPPSGVDQDSSAMYTIDDIYNRLNNGADGEKRTGTDGFQEPDSAPASSTDRKTLNDVMGKMPVEDNTNGATAADVVYGKVFWGLRTDGTWGRQVGTLRWYDHGNGTYTDLLTGLMWGNPLSLPHMYWDDAVAAVEELTTGGYSDWRMPTVDELRTLGHVDGGTTGTWVEPSKPFFNSPYNGRYWTSTPWPPDRITVVYFSDGQEGGHLKETLIQSWPVRNTECNIVLP